MPPPKRRSPLEIFVEEGFDKEFLAEEVELNPPPRFPPIIKAATLCHGLPVEPAELVEGLLHQGSKLIYGGPSKSFKSWALLDLSISVAAGVPWMGFNTVQRPSLYVNLELQDFAINKRIRAICSAKGIPVPPLFSVWNLRGHACPLDQLIPELLAQIEGEGYGLIVPDPIYKTLAGRDENAAGDIGRVCNEIELLAVQTGAAVAFGAHFAKGDASKKESIDRIAGSGVFARDPDSILVATYHEEKDSLTISATLRNFPPREDFVVRWEFPLLVPNPTLDPAAIRKGGRTEEFTADRLLSCLVDGMTAAEWQRATEETLGCSRITFYRKKVGLEKRDLVALTDGKYAHVTGVK